MSRSLVSRVWSLSFPLSAFLLLLFWLRRMLLSTEFLCAL
jgi:hypothetical protein